MDGNTDLDSRKVVIKIIVNYLISFLEKKFSRSYPIPS